MRPTVKAPTYITRVLNDFPDHRDLQRRQTLLLQGDVSRHAYYIESGCLRLCYNDDGNDITVQFFQPGEIVASLESFLKGEPSRFGIEAIVPSSVRVIDKVRFEEHMNASGSLRDFLFEALLTRLSDYQTLFLNRIMESPEKRYRHLLAQNPALFEIVPQHYIASFLGVTPVSLSRIRKKVEES
ncbi:Crp/Fnr family transcriptional regulator [Celeribacter baekdonensis]|uniref:Crp/Fnr family transcriptional regulator n=1 Tax=Celeribacter baekdonensis TaxID=875171 RepID=A0A2R4M1R0_9RHOB|nr:Crp/Fnr family transcriptional regulator [Celeribacter baekdonensis]